MLQLAITMIKTEEWKWMKGNLFPFGWTYVSSVNHIVWFEEQPRRNFFQTMIFEPWCPTVMSNIVLLAIAVLMRWRLQIILTSSQLLQKKRSRSATLSSNFLIAMQWTLYRPFVVVLSHLLSNSIQRKFFFRWWCFELLLRNYCCSYHLTYCHPASFFQ